MTSKTTNKLSPEARARERQWALIRGEREARDSALKLLAEGPRRRKRH